MESIYGLQENVAKNLVFVDGITRCGKFIFSDVLPSLKNFEHIRFLTELELVVPALRLGSINLDFARAFLRIYFNEIVNHMFLGRDVNFRFDDVSGVFNHRDPKMYLKRLMQPEGAEVFEKLRMGEHFFPFLTHDLLVNLDIVQKLDLDCTILALFRNPIDNIYSWYTRGWGTRFVKNDPDCKTLMLSHGDSFVPWYCKGYEKEWLALNPMERCVQTAMDLIKQSVEQYKKHGKKLKIHVFTFEDFVQNTDEELEKICSFLGAEVTELTPVMLNRARCPRVLDPLDRKQKLEKLKTMVREHLFTKLIDLEQQYREETYGLCN